MGAARRTAALNKANVNGYQVYSLCQKSREGFKLSLFIQTKTVIVMIKEN